MLINYLLKNIEQLTFYIYNIQTYEKYKIKYHYDSSCSSSLP